MRDVLKFWKERNFYEVYCRLKKMSYDYTLGNLDKDFKKILDIDKYCYLVYLISREFTVKNVLLLCDFLMYDDVCFFDAYPVVKWYLMQALNTYPMDKDLLEWIMCTFEGHPSSPFSEEELSVLREHMVRLNDR